MTDAVWLSTFSFETLEMYKDLGALTGVALASPVIRRIAGVLSDLRRALL